MVFVGTPYGQNPQILVTDGIGGSPYGPGTLAGPDGSRQPVESGLTTAGTSAVALLASRAVSKTSGKVVRPRPIRWKFIGLPVERTSTVPLIHCDRKNRTHTHTHTHTHTPRRGGEAA